MYYGAGIWEKAKMKSFYIFQHKAMRFFLCVHKFANNTEHGDMGWLKSKFPNQQFVVCMWNRFISLNSERLKTMLLNDKKLVL